VDAPPPRDDFAQVLLAFTQIRLQGNADRRLLLELRFFQDGSEQRERQVLELVTLHVEVDKGANFDGAAENRTQPELKRGNALFRIGGMDIRREGGNLDRQIEARKGSLRTEVAECRIRVPGEGGGDDVEYLQISLEEAVGLRLGDHRFTEQVDRRGPPGAGVQTELFDEVVRGFAGDELTGHLRHLGFHGIGHERGASEAAARPV